MKKAVFIDRDGTINWQRNDEDVIKWGDFELLKNSDKAINLLNKNNIKVIVITNQPIVAKGFATEDDVKKINKKIIEFLRKRDAIIDDLYYCPHYPEKGFPGENLKYKIKCDCRKPGIGMLKKAQIKFGLNFNNCFMVGDRTKDIQTGKNAGCKTILVKTGKAGNDGKHDIKPDYICENLFEAAKLIVKLYGEKK